MIYLLIDTCTSNLILSLIKDDIILEQVIQKNDNNLSTIFTSMIERILKNNSLTIDDLDIIFVSNGPGSFTGVRIGLTSAKVLAWAKNIKVIPFSSLELLATTNISSCNVAILDARRDYVYAGVYDNNLKCLIKDQYISLKDLFNELEKYSDVSFISCDEFGFSVEKPTYDTLKIIDKYKNHQGVNPHTLNPNYLKKTEAEEKIVVNYD